MPVKLIIFDLDGTLIDSSIDITNAINYSIEPYGGRLLTADETISLVGEGMTRLIEKLMEMNDITADRDVILDRFVEHYASHLTDNSPAYPGVNETLKALSGYKKAVISNKRETLSQRILDELGLSVHFDLIVGSDTTPERKPSPVPVRYVLSKFDVQPEEAVIVGDSNFDIEAGKAAGIGTIAVTYGYRPVEMLKEADFMINSMSGLVGVIDRINGGATV